MRRLSFAAAASLCLLLTPPLAQAGAGGGKTYTSGTPSRGAAPAVKPASSPTSTVDCRTSGASGNPF
ncbi:MAG TPA: hypothetical protein VIP10_07150, partial [Burkholderiaceae bacterium]